MAYVFGDGFDLYAAPADAGTYWDGINVGSTVLVPGRFPGSQAAQWGNSNNTAFTKNGANDSVHHFVLAMEQTTAISGTNLGLFIELFDGVTAQCSVVFRQDGAILLVAGAPGGTVLATYTAAVTGVSTWYAFEIEVVVSSTAGSMTVRKNGNTSNDFQSATNLNTRATANNYANKITVGAWQVGTPTVVLDDFLWRSDASSVPWVGDIRCYTRRPASDVSVQWTPSGSVVPLTPITTNGTTNIALNTAKYMPFTPACSGTVGTATMTVATAVTANVKAAIYASSGSAPTTPLGTSNAVSNPGVGTVTFTFPTPPSVTLGTAYYFAVDADATSGTYNYQTTPGTYAPLSGATTYATFPATNPTGLSAGSAYGFTVNITPTGAANAPFVADTVQDAANSYVYSSTNTQADLYGISSIGSTPTTVVAVTTRGYFQKSDAGTRNAAVQLKSGGTTVQSTSTALNTTWAHLYRTDTTDPATGSAWTATAVNNCQVGPIVTA